MNKILITKEIEEAIDNSRYNEAAEVLAKHLNLIIKIEFLHNGKHFNDDDTYRDIYQIAIQRGNRDYTFEFEQSISESGFYYTKGRQKVELDREYLEKDYLELAKIIKMRDYSFLNNGKSDIIHYPKTPTYYDILACLTKYDPGTFEDFCSEFGYNVDSKKAEKTYNAVKDEWLNVERLFNIEEIELLQLIQ